MPEHSGHGFNLNTSITKRFPSEEAYWLCTIYVEIEGLVRSLMALEAWNETLKKQPERSDRRTWKTTLSASYDDVHSKLADTVKNWLEDALADAPSSFDTSFIRELRNIYIPELTFALHELYVEASKWISKTLLANCLELATVVADPGRSVLNTFIQTGRVEEYVCAVAGASRSVLGAGMEKSGLGIWNVR
jgi:nuclear pore complex protein Nup107